VSAKESSKKRTSKSVGKGAEAHEGAQLSGKSKHRQVGRNITSRAPETNRFGGDGKIMGERSEADWVVIGREGIKTASAGGRGIGPFKRVSSEKQVRRGTLERGQQTPARTGRHGSEIKGSGRRKPTDLQRGGKGP